MGAAPLKSVMQLGAGGGKLLEISDKLLSWAPDIDEGAKLQALRSSRLDIVAGHIALMPDAHVGIGATIGSVIPTKNAVIPSAVGVDIGCGIIGVQTDLIESDLPDLDSFLLDLEYAIPAGVGKGHEYVSSRANTWFNANHSRFSDKFDTGLGKKLLDQFGTLGSGNHFFEICLDESLKVWIVLHSGSRGLGNQLATRHIKVAKHLMRDQHIHLEDPDLAYFQENSEEFDAYIADMLACQDYALANRETMMDNALRIFFLATGKGRQLQRINCHHNFTQKEIHNDESLWITRKGAIKANVGALGIIPGSMGTNTYVVEGLGNPLSYNSCAHGAGRRHSRSQAKALFSAKDLAEQMGNIHWQSTKGQYLIDEIPGAYKDINQVMENQRDLVTIIHTLRQVLNYKGN